MYLYVPDEKEHPRTSVKLSSSLRFFLTSTILSPCRPSTSHLSYTFHLTSLLSYLDLHLNGHNEHSAVAGNQHVDYSELENFEQFLCARQEHFFCDSH
jgi:hypothetical protein